MLRLAEITNNQEKLKIVDITSLPIVRERLLELGLQPGQEIRLLRKMPFKGPVVVEAGSVVVSLRHEEASEVWVE